MQYIDRFKEFLFSQKQKASALTVKNYVADVNHFIKWFEKYYKLSFNPSLIKSTDWNLFVDEKKTLLSESSLKRHKASLKKFYACIEQLGIQNRHPFQEVKENKIPNDLDPYRIDDFRRFLNSSKASRLTTKNYINDLKQFVVYTKDQNLPVNESLGESILPENLLNFYKESLIQKGHLSISSINRKVYALKKYLGWMSKNISKANKAYQEDFTKNLSEAVNKDNQKYSFLHQEAKPDFENLLQQKATQKQTANAYAKFPPLRLLQKTIKAINIFFDIVCINNIITFSDKLSYLSWILKGKPVFSKSLRLPIVKKTTELPLASKISFVKRLDISFQKLIHTLRYKRPSWYQGYHQYAMIHYFHYAVLIIILFAFGFDIYQSFFGTLLGNRPIFASLPTAPPRLLTFQGKLTDRFGNPISGKKPLRFGIYSSPVASGSAMLWQEVDKATADKNGNVSVVLGHRNQLSSDLFHQQQNLWLGVSVENSDELVPREQIATTGYAANAETVQGLVPITQADAGDKNVLLALDSSGNLTIGGNASPTFQATGGDFRISGETLVLSTNPGSSGSIILSPDGIGTIDLEKPLQNLSNYNNIPSAQGSVEVDDTFAILATSSGQSAFTINQNGIGPLISASASGVPKFTIQNDGTILTAGNFSLEGHVLSSLIPDSNTLNIGSSSAQWNSIYAKQIYQNGIPVKQLLQENNNTIYPLSSLENFAIGQESSTSAMFQVLADSGNIITQGNINLISSSSAIGTENQQTLKIGTQTTGAVAINPNNSTGLFVNNNGSVGIGKTDLLSQIALQIEKNSLGNSLVVANQQGLGDIFNASSSGTTRFVIGNKGDTKILGASLCIKSVNANCSGNTPGTIYATTTTLQSADVAENYISKDQLEPGDVVIPEAKGSDQAITKSIHPYQNQLLGIVSTEPGVRLNSDAHPDNNHPYIVPIALSGRVPVKVSMENGPVSVGDLLTSSSIPGIAMKSIKPGMIIGKALEDFHADTAGKIMAFISLSWADPLVYLTDNGSLHITASLALDNQEDQAKNYLLQDNVGNIINRIASLSQAMIANLQTGMINTKELIAENMSAVNAYIRTGKVDNLSVNNSLISPVAEIALIKTNLISPLSQDGQIAVKIDNTTLSIHPDANASSAAVATFDNQGNASFSGTLRSSGLDVHADATVSGILRAHKILADQIEGLDKSGSLSAQYITNVTNIYNATSSADESNTASAAGIALSDTNYNLVDKKYTDIASVSGSLLYTPHLDIAAATFQQGLMSFGPTSLSDTAIAGQLSIGGQFILADNSINVLGADLQIQPLKQGGIAFAGRQIYIDTNGNLTVNGNATFNGTLAANVIAPIPNHDLVVKLPANQSSEKQNSQFIVRNASNSAIFELNQLGDIIGSGSATISKLNFLNPEPVLAISDNEIAASGSAGVATISAHQTQLTIDNPLVTDQSLIYISPVGKSGDQTPYLFRQIPKESFTVGIQQPLTSDTIFNWLIIN